jgi:hypothetical protein
MKVSVAQQIRLWVGVFVGFLLMLSVFGMAGSLTSVNNWSGNGATGLYDTNAGGFDAWFGLAITSIVAEAGLAGVTIYRIYRPSQAQKELNK